MRRTPSSIGPHPVANPANPGPSSQYRAPRSTRQKCHKVYITRYIRNCKPIVMSESSVYTGGTVAPPPRTSSQVFHRKAPGGGGGGTLPARLNPPHIPIRPHHRAQPHRAHKVPCRHVARIVHSQINPADPNSQDQRPRHHAHRHPLPAPPQCRMPRKISEPYTTTASTECPLGNE
jgi:hypothetical protein